MKNALISSLRESSWVRLVLGIFAMVLVIVFASADALIRVYRERQMLPFDYHTNLILTAIQSVCSHKWAFTIRNFLGD